MLVGHHQRSTAPTSASARGGQARSAARPEISRSTNLHWGIESADSCYELAAKYIGAGFSEFLVELDGDIVVDATEAFAGDGLPRLHQLAKPAA